MKYLFILISIIILIFLINFFIKKSKKIKEYKSIYWINQPINRENSGKILIKNPKLFTIKDETLKLLENNIDEEITDNYNRYINDMLIFLNKYYNDDIFFEKETFTYMLDANNPKEILFNILRKNEEIVGLICLKTINLKIFNDNSKILVVDFGCLSNEIRGKYIFTHLINNCINTMKLNNISYGIHKKDHKPLPVKSHSKFTYYYFFTNKVYVSKFLMKKFPTNQNELNSLHLKCQKHFYSFVVSPIFSLNEFIIEFGDKKNHLTFWNSNPFVFINGFFQKYKYFNKIYKVFEIRYLLFDNYSNEISKLLKNCINYIIYNFNIEVILLQDFGYNYVLKNLFNFKKGHDSYLYILNLNIKDIDKKKYCFHF